LTLFAADTLEMRHTHTVDKSSSPMAAHYDYDTNVLWLQVPSSHMYMTVSQGKGDMLIHMFEVVAAPPWLLQLTACNSLQVSASRVTVVKCYGSRVVV